MKFLITGLPRTRTAWFAAYFTGQPDTVCYHEAASMGHEMDIPYSNIGNSEAGVPLEWVAEWNPDKIVVVHRPVVEVARSLEIIGMPIQQGYLERVDATNQKLEGLHVDFYEIDMAEIHDYLELPYDHYKADLMVDMNIQSKYWRM